MSFLTAYQETTTVDTVLTVLNSLNYFGNIFILSFLGLISLGIIGFAHKNYLPSNFKEPKSIYYAAFFIALFFTVLNFSYGYYLNFLGFISVSAIIIVLFFKNVSRKSLKWFSSCLCLFMSCVLLLYVGSLEIIAQMNLTGLEHLGLTSYHINYKSLFAIYREGDSLLTMSYALKGENFNVDNTVVYKRIYIFYYFMNTIAVSFWLFVYHRVLGLHGIKIR